MELFGLIFSLTSWIANTIQKLINLFIDHPIIGTIVIVVVGGSLLTQRHRTAKDFIQNQHGYILLDGLFAEGKTRFLTLLSREAKAKKKFVLSNFYNEYEDVRWNSKSDLGRLLDDLWLLGEYQNFTNEDIKKIYAKEGKARVNDKMEARKRIARKFKHIPSNGYFTECFLAGDEMQNIFFNREAMTNFSGDGRTLNKKLHQVRHFNLLTAFALTEVSELDPKFRKIASYYISISTMLRGLLIKYNVYTFTTDKKNNFDIDQAREVTRVPVLSFNGYVANKLINVFESKIYGPIFKKRIKFRFAELGFFSKFNADPDFDIYVPGMLFDVLNAYYETEKKEKFLNSN